VPNGTHKVVFSPEAKADLLELYRYIAEASGQIRALGYIERVERKCLNLSTFPMRGMPRDDIRQGLRVIGFERSANIAFAVVEKCGHHSAGIVRRPRYRQGHVARITDARSRASYPARTLALTRVSPAGLRARDTPPRRRRRRGIDRHARRRPAGCHARTP